MANIFLPRGPHTRDHLQGIIGDHYKIEDVDLTDEE